MKCVVCDSKSVIIHERDLTTMHGVTHRTYDCPKCNTQFKTSEKVVFTSLPPAVRNKFISEGKRK